VSVLGYLLPVGRTKLGKHDTMNEIANNAGTGMEGPAKEKRDEKDTLLEDHAQVEVGTRVFYIIDCLL